jgi:hypothetical protein
MPRKFALSNLKHHAEVTVPAAKTPIAATDADIRMQ